MTQKVLLNVVVKVHSFSSKDQPLLIKRNSFLILDFGLWSFPKGFAKTCILGLERGLNH